MHTQPVPGRRDRGGQHLVLGAGRPQPDLVAEHGPAVVEAFREDPRAPGHPLDVRQRGAPQAGQPCHRGAQLARVLGNDDDVEVRRGGGGAHAAHVVEPSVARRPDHQQRRVDGIERVAHRSGVAKPTAGLDDGLVRSRNWPILWAVILGAGRPGVVLQPEDIKIKDLSVQDIRHHRERVPGHLVLAACVAPRHVQQCVGEPHAEHAVQVTAAARRRLVPLMHDRPHRRPVGVAFSLRKDVRHHAVTSVSTTGLLHRGLPTRVGREPRNPYSHRSASACSALPANVAETQVVPPVPAGSGGRSGR
jgi:hypothetical protein